MSFQVSTLNIFHDNRIFFSPPRQSYQTSLAQVARSATHNIDSVDVKVCERSLEDLYLSHVVNLDIDDSSVFQFFLVPNERTPFQAKPHLDWSIPGLLISTGSVRSLFDLAMADPDKCTGLVIRDINPKVKAYMDFELLMIRLSYNHETYQELAAPFEETTSLDTSASFHTRLDKLKQLLSASLLCDELKKYYFAHLQKMAMIYFGAQSNVPFRECWKSASSFEEVNYYKHPAVFFKIQKYAQEGKIIATVGPIDELEFLGNVVIGLVDISNIPDYFLLNFKIQGILQKIMWTAFETKSTQNNVHYEEEWRYYSSSYSPLVGQAQREYLDLTRYLQELKDSERSYFDFNLWILETAKKMSALHPVKYTPYVSTQLLTLLKRYENALRKFDAKETNEMNTDAHLYLNSPKPNQIITKNFLLLKP